MIEIFALLEALGFRSSKTAWEERVSYGDCM